MRAPDFNEPGLAALRARVRSADAQQAFDLLVQAGIDAVSLNASPGGPGYSKDFRYQRVAPKGWPFAFTANREYLLFCLRPLGRRTLGASRASLGKVFGEVRRRADDELQIVVRTAAEARTVIEHILNRWPGEQSARVESTGINPGPAALIQAARGQGEFRANVERVEGACRITGLMDRRHLRAIHIKPWQECSDVEKLDGHNGLLLSPHIAHLFEQGHISFADNGQVLVSKQMNSAVLKRWHIVVPIAAQPFLPAQGAYLAWHREHVFEKAARGGRRRG